LRKIILYSLLFSLISISNVFGESDTLLVRDLSRDWVFFDNKTEEFLPLVEKSVFKGNTIFFWLSLEDYANTSLHVTSVDQSVSLFVDNKLLDVVEGNMLIPVNNIFQDFHANRVKVTIYSSKLNPYKVDTKLVDIVEESVSPLSQDNIIVLPRDKAVFDNFFVVGCTILIVFLAALFNFFPRVLADFFKFSKAINPREVEENLIKSRPLSQINLLFYLFISVLISLFIIGIINFGDFKYSLSFFRPNSVPDGLWKWLQTSVILFLCIIVKLGLIHYFSKLYRIHNFLNTHFFNYMRLSMVLFSLSIAALIGSRYIFFALQPSHYSLLLGVFYVLMAVNILIIYLKLINSVSSKKIHLFSYLCGTEIVPFGIILSLGINQTF